MQQHFTLTISLAAMILLTTSCSLPAMSEKWVKYSFNGHQFQIGSGENSPFIWLRDGYTPRRDDPREVSPDNGKLPPKRGAVAGICFARVTGGKLTDTTGVIPLPEERITISNSNSGTSYAKSDSAGFFVEVLLPGDYQLTCRGTGTGVRVKQGQTALVTIRGAKRMND
jgi:hypothetical protein